MFCHFFAFYLKFKLNAFFMWKNISKEILRAKMAYETEEYLKLDKKGVIAKDKILKNRIYLQIVKN